MADSVARVLALAALNSGGGGDVPENRKVPTSTTADAGKLLAVGANGTRAWTTVFTLTDTTLDITVPEVASNNPLGNSRLINDIERPRITFPAVEEPEEPEDNEEDTEVDNPEVNEPEAEPESEEPEIEEEIPEENEEEVPEEE